MDSVKLEPQTAVKLKDGRKGFVVGYDGTMTRALVVQVDHRYHLYDEDGRCLEIASHTKPRDIVGPWVEPPPASIKYMCTVGKGHMDNRYYVDGSEKLAPYQGEYVEVTVRLVSKEDHE